MAWYNKNAKNIQCFLVTGNATSEAQANLWDRSLFQDMFGKLYCIRKDMLFIC